MTLTCNELRPGSSKVAIYVRNLSAGPITIPAKMTIRYVSTANIVPLMLAPKKLMRTTKKREVMQTKQL